MERKSHSELMANAIVYTYPGGEVDIVAASDKVWYPEGYEAAEDFSGLGRKGPEPAKREKGKKSEGDDMLRSMRRARANLRRMALANDFRWFVTLTLDRQRIDRYDGAEILRHLKDWLGNAVQRQGLKYILVPERHKDGAWHFHGFFNDVLEAVDSGHTDRCGHPVYNLPRWGWGFSTAIELYGDYAGAVAYVCKYIGKQEGQRPLGRWYYSGGKLAKPSKTYAALDYRGLQEDFQGEAVEFDIPGSKLLCIRTKATKVAEKEDKTSENGVPFEPGSGPDSGGADTPESAGDANMSCHRAAAGGCAEPQAWYAQASFLGDGAENWKAAASWFTGTAAQ